MHNDVYQTQKQKICQAWSRDVYRAKTGTWQRPLQCSGTLLHRNLCKRQKQNVALQTGSRHADLFRNVRGRAAVCVRQTLLGQAYGTDRGQD
jgi:hypothetical protein